MHQVCHYNPAERQQSKKRQRASDAVQLREGRISLEELRARNSFLYSLEIVESSISCQEVFA